MRLGVFAGAVGGADHVGAETAGVETGRDLYVVHCADCHGADARGGNGPDIQGVRRAFVEDAIAGVEQMPEILLSVDEVSALVAFLAQIARESD